MVNIGVIGYGYWGPNLVRNLYETEDCKVKYVCDLKDKNLDTVKKRFPSTIPTKDYNEVLNDREIDGIVIATPVSTHFKFVKSALLKDKNVLVEKPLCSSVKNAEELIRISEKRKKIVMVSHTFLYSPPVIKIKELINQKTLGKIYYIDSSRVNLGLFQPDVSVVWDLAPHDVAIVLYWLNDLPKKVSCVGSSFVRKDIHEVAYISLFFQSGIEAHLHVSWLAPSKLRRTVIIGDKKMVIYDDTDPGEKIKIYDKGVERNPETFGEFHLTYRTGDVVSPHLDAVEPLKVECGDFIKSISEKTKPKSDIMFGLNVVKVLSAAEKSSKKQGKQVLI